ncbi:prolyl aminopeptidase [Candidatus Pacearchaeota archaeon CG_4_9_14_0_2_um_filter_39_13]|nr:prolyl aminopeptidase [Candidatus Pacearchaeota archaeon]OIO42153.1 MAG: prolyl aminopeptidase [Candidatus Pacearchaeota archaeon CG1_02_39_14]PJC44545.1 MAG: prolyl aminopeptidase [Candidatus Pacearchaeota archaeon CG_4_9_14_0_2_um_filter_39_13]
MSKPKKYFSGYLDVGSGHEIYYELSGNKKGKPILFLHGGPGGGFSQKDKRFFNPKKFNMIHFDQRGSGKSRPFASLKDNTTFNLVGDIKKLLNHLKIKKTLIFGGSWGSTLALVYAIRYPETVAGMVIRGIYLPSKEENEYFTYGAKNHFPEQWKKLSSLVPEKIIIKRQIENYYYKKILSGNHEEKIKYSKAWAEYEFSISKLVYSKKKVEEVMKEVKTEAFSAIELHYLTHSCFMPKDYILKNAHKIKQIPASIIHGRYDCVCRPLSAYKLHKLLPKSSLIFTTAGHGTSEKETQDALIKETNKLLKIKI